MSLLKTRGLLHAHAFLIASRQWELYRVSMTVYQMAYPELVI